MLESDVCFFDLETTGVDTEIDRVVEIAIVKLKTDGTRERFHTLVNPGIPIPHGASDVHGIYDEDVFGKPMFAQISREIIEFIGDSDLGGYNVLRFDIPLIMAEFGRCGINFDFRKRKVFDAFALFIKREPRDLSAAVKMYLGKEMEDAHSALADTEASLDVFLAQMVRYQITPDEVITETQSSMVDLGGLYKRDDNGEVVFAKGKHTGSKAYNHWDNNYMGWVVDKSNFCSDTKEITLKILRGEKV